MVTRNMSYTDKEKVFEIILNRIETKMNKRIHIGTFGVIKTNDKVTQVHYLVE